MYPRVEGGRCGVTRFTHFVTSHSRPSRSNPVYAVMLVGDSPRREGVLPAGDIRGNWNVTLVTTDV